MNKKIGFIGCGKMASAIISGIIKSNYLTKTNIFASEINQEKASAKEKELGIKIVTDNK